MALLPISGINRFQSPVAAIPSFKKKAPSKSSFSSSQPISSSLPPLSPTPLGLGAVQDSLSSAPAVDPLLRLLQLNIVFTQLNQEDADLLETQILQSQQRHVLLSNRQTTLIDKKAQQVSTLGSWKAAKDIIAYGSYAASVTLGIGFCTSPVGATALIASGTIGITSKLMSDTGAWRWIASQLTTDENSLQKYTSNLETVATVASLGASLISGFMSSGALNLAGNFWPTAISATTATVATAASVGSDITQSSTLKTEAQMKEVEMGKKEVFNTLTFQNDHIRDISQFNKQTLPILSFMVDQNFMYV